MHHQQKYASRLIIDESHIILLNIYAPNDINQQVTFFRSLQNLLAEFAQENIVVAGDFNCTLTEMDKKGGSLNYYGG